MLAAVDTGSLSMSLEELCSSIKEPEEADHAAKCHLLQDGSTTEQTASTASEDWLNILGHDRLRKRVSYVSVVCCQMFNVEVGFFGILNNI